MTENSDTSNNIPQELLSNLLDNLNNAAEERLEETESDANDSTIDIDEDLDDDDDNNGDYDYIDNLEEDFDINLMDEIDYKDILSQFFETKDGDNVADLLFSIKHSIDQNSKCIMKLCKVIESFQSIAKTKRSNTPPPAASPDNKSKGSDGR